MKLTIVELTCDLCAERRTASTTVELLVDGGRWELDLCEAHALDYRDAMRPFVSAAREQKQTRRCQRREQAGC